MEVNSNYNKRLVLCPVVHWLSHYTQVLEQQVLKSGYIKADESPIQVLDKDKKAVAIRVICGYSIVRNGKQCYLNKLKVEITCKDPFAVLGLHSNATDMLRKQVTYSDLKI